MQILKLDFQSQGLPPIVPVMQHDSRSRYIGIALYNGGSPYQAPDGAVYTVQYRGPGAGNIGWYDTIRVGDTTHPAVTLDADSPHIITMELAEQALCRSGDVRVNLCVLTDSGYMLTSFDIIARVTAAYPDEAAVASYFYVAGLSSAKWLAYVAACQQARQRAEAAAQSILGYAGGAIVAGGTVTLAADGWAAAEGAYPWQYLAPVEASKVSYLPTAVPTTDSLAAVRAARAAPLCQARDGLLRFWAMRKPTVDIVVQVVLIAPGSGGVHLDDAMGTFWTGDANDLPVATPTTLGGIMAGDNLTVTEDGTLSLTKAGVCGALGYTPAALPYSITYDHSYTGTGEKGSADAPVVIPLAQDYDAVAVISVGTDYTVGTEAARQRMLLELVTGENASSNFANNWVSLKVLSSNFVSGDKVGGLNVLGGKWSYPNTYLRRSGKALEVYSSIPALAWNAVSTQYHVFGITMPSTILPPDHYETTAASAE